MYLKHWAWSAIVRLPPLKYAQDVKAISLLRQPPVGSNELVHLLKRLRVKSGTVKCFPNHPYRLRCSLQLWNGWNRDHGGSIRLFHKIWIPTFQALTIYNTRKQHCQSSGTCRLRMQWRGHHPSTVNIFEDSKAALVSIAVQAATCKQMLLFSYKLREKKWRSTETDHKWKKPLVSWIHKQFELRTPSDSPKLRLFENFGNENMPDSRSKTMAAWIWFFSLVEGYEDQNAKSLTLKIVFGCGGGSRAFYAKRTKTG